MHISLIRPISLIGCRCHGDRLQCVKDSTKLGILEETVPKSFRVNTFVQRQPGISSVRSAKNTGFCLPFGPFSNCLENFFNEMKNYKGPYSFLVKISKIFSKTSFLGVILYGEPRSEKSFSYFFGQKVEKTVFLSFLFLRLCRKQRTIGFLDGYRCFRTLKIEDEIKTEITFPR